MRFAFIGKPVRLWADIDAKWSGTKNSKPEIDYEVDVLGMGRWITRPPGSPRAAVGGA